MNKQLKQVEDFHKAFNLTVNQKPCLLNDEVATLRYHLLQEENEEYLEAVNQDDITEMVDALGDQLYIVLGSIITHGCQHIIEKVFDEIQRSNMSKLENGVPLINGHNIFVEDKPLGKVIKSKSWSPPDIKSIIKL